VTLDSDLSGPRDACGVFGMYAPGQPVSHSTYLGLYALQHRGQESAGISVSDGETITVV
jgi:amidophosphoribosyltransferase